MLFLCYLISLLCFPHRPLPHCFLFEVREAEVRIDATIGPVEESFALLNKHELFFNDGSAERVDGLTYAWKNLNALVRGGVHVFITQTEH